MAGRSTDEVKPADPEALTELFPVSEGEGHALRTTLPPKTHPPLAIGEEGAQFDLGPLGEFPSEQLPPVPLELTPEPWSHDLPVEGGGRSKLRLAGYALAAAATLAVAARLWISMPAYDASIPGWAEASSVPPSDRDAATPEVVSQLQPRVPVQEQRSP